MTYNPTTHGDLDLYYQNSLSIKTRAKGASVMSNFTQAGCTNYRLGLTELPQNRVMKVLLYPQIKFNDEAYFWQNCRTIAKNFNESEKMHGLVWIMFRRHHRTELLL